MTFEQYSARVPGKKCPICLAKLAVKDVVWMQASNNGWAIENQFYAYNAIVSCPNPRCKKEVSMESLGLHEVRSPVNYVM